MLTPTLTAALQAQFNRERANEAFYSALADLFNTQYWPGFASWMKRQAGDEAGHARRLAGYLSDQNVIPAYDALPAVPLTEGSPAQVFAAALAREQETTALIDQLYHLAEIEEHPATCELLLYFVREQVEEERQFVDILTALARADCSAAVLMLDREKLKEA
jgi:ferritin